MHAAIVARSRRIAFPYPTVQLISLVRESRPPMHLRSCKAANDPAYGADDAVDGQRSEQA